MRTRVRVDIRVIEPKTYKNRATTPRTTQSREFPLDTESLLDVLGIYSKNMVIAPVRRGSAQRTRGAFPRPPGRYCMRVSMNHTLSLAPIVKGYRFAFALNFIDAEGAPPPGFDLASATRVMGQFRAARNAADALLATVDTADGSLTVVDANTISFTIPANATATMTPGQPAWVDFAWLVADDWRHIPVIIAWPVIDPVTIPPT